jgi:hypothetical protein
MEMMTAGGVTLAAFVGGVVGVIVLFVLVLWASLRVSRDADCAVPAGRADGGPDEGQMSPVSPELEISIPSSLVGSLRGAGYANLGTAAEAIAALTTPGDRETSPKAYAPLLDRLDGARALLDAVDWRERAPQPAVRLGAGLHEPLKAALDLALLVAETRAEMSGNAEDGEALSRLAREIDPTPMPSGEEREHVLDGKLNGSR